MHVRVLHQRTQAHSPVYATVPPSKLLQANALTHKLICTSTIIIDQPHPPKSLSPHTTQAQNPEYEKHSSNTPPHIPRNRSFQKGKARLSIHPSPLPQTPVPTSMQPARAGRKPTIRTYKKSNGRNNTGNTGNPLFGICITTTTSSYYIQVFVRPKLWVGIFLIYNYPAPPPPPPPVLFSDWVFFAELVCGGGREGGDAGAGAGGLLGAEVEVD